MPFCRKCGTKLDENQKYCHKCGCPVLNINNQNTQNNNYNPNYQNQQNGYCFPPLQRKLSTGLLIFSIITIFVSKIFGFSALTFTLLAQNAKTDAEESSRKKIALILNIAGLSAGIILFILATLIIIYFGVRIVLFFLILTALKIVYKI